MKDCISIAIVIAIILCILYIVITTDIVVGTMITCLFSALLLSDNDNSITGGNDMKNESIQDIKTTQMIPSYIKKNKNNPNINLQLKKLAYMLNTKHDIYSIYLTEKKDKWCHVGNDFKLSHKFSDDILNKLPQNGIYVDYGSGSSLIANAISKRYNYDLYCLDIDDYRIDKKSSKFIYGKDIDSIDVVKNATLISAIQSLHHINFGTTSQDFVTSLNSIVKKIHSTLMSGGYFLIRDHDVQTLNDLYSVIYEHLLYDIVEIKDKSMTKKQLTEYIENYYNTHKGWYFSKNYLHSILSDHGFKLVITEKKQGKNVSCIYNSLYVKT